jgi:hypothetical protein
MEITTGSLGIFFSSPCQKNKCIHHVIKQVLAGHCRLIQHLQEIGKKTSATCECEIEEESVYHTIFLTAFVLLTTEQKSKNKITKKMTKNFLRS